MDTVIRVVLVFLVALSPLIIGTVVVRVIAWITGRTGRHRLRPPSQHRPPGLHDHSTSARLDRASWDETDLADGSSGRHSRRDRTDDPTGDGRP